MSAIVFEPTRVSKLRRGMIAKDITTGIVGMVVSISLDIAGSSQVCLQPMADKPNDKAPDTRWIDEQTAEYESDGELARFDYAEPVGEWDFGDPVRDRLSGASGLISEFQLCRDGCVFASIVPKTDYAANSPQSVSVSIARLQRITDAPRAEVKANPDSGPCDPRPGSGRRI